MPIFQHLMQGPFVISWWNLIYAGYGFFGGLVAFLIALKRGVISEDPKTIRKQLLIEIVGGTITGSIVGPLFASGLKGHELVAAFTFASGAGWVQCVHILCGRNSYVLRRAMQEQGIEVPTELAESDSSGRFVLNEEEDTESSESEANEESAAEGETDKSDDIA